MAVLPLLAPVLRCATPVNSAPAATVVRADNGARRPFKMKPGEIARPSPHQGLREGEERDQQTRRNRVEPGLDARTQHVGDGHAKRSAEHQVRHDPQARHEDTEPEEENREREPFDAAEVRGDFRLRRGIDGLEKSFAEDAVIDDRPVDEPTEARRSVNLTRHFAVPVWAEENKILKRSIDSASP